jgi:hypothetical protein
MDQRADDPVQPGVADVSRQDGQLQRVFRWPTLAGLGFAALVASDLMSGVDLAPVLAASAAVYLGAAALQRPAAAWPLFFATGAVITVAQLLDDRFDPTWAILAGSVALLIYGLGRGAIRPGYGLPLQTVALAGFGAAAAAALLVTPELGAYLPRGRRPPRARRLGRQPPSHQPGRRPLPGRVLPGIGHRAGSGDRNRDDAVVIKDRGPTTPGSRVGSGVARQSKGPRLRSSGKAVSDRVRRPSPFRPSSKAR